MTLRRIWAVCRKEFLHVLRDPRSLGMGIVIPMLMMMLFGYALTLDLDRVPLVVLDQAGTTQSRELVSRFTGSRYFLLKANVRDYTAIERMINDGRALAALVIPSDFLSHTGAGGGSPLQLILDGSDANTASMALGYARNTVAHYSQALIVEAARRTGKPEPRAPVSLDARVWFNEDLESRNYIVPGFMAVIMAIIAALLTSMTVSREWERGTMEQLISTPVKVPELILGKFLPYFVIGMLDVLISVLMAEFLFHVPMRGSLALLFAVAALFLSGALCQGILISIVAKNQMVASEMAIVSTFLPAFLLSGFIYPISNMPQVLQLLTHIIPARYFVTLVKGIYLKGVGLEVMWLEALLLAGFCVLLVVAANRKLRKKME